MNRLDFDHTKLQGPDVDIETSLKEYGRAWIESDSDILFYIGVRGDGYEYTAFDFTMIGKDTDVFEEFDWVDFDEVSDYTGYDLKDKPLVQQVEDLLDYYGAEEIFGVGGWEGLTYAQVVGTREFKFTVTLYGSGVDEHSAWENVKNVVWDEGLVDYDDCEEAK